MHWWVSDLAQNGHYVELISWVFWVLLSITLHELGHGWAAIRQGDDTPVRLNRMTANPVVHMGVPSLVIFALCGIAWGAMPVNPHRFRNRRWGEVLVSAAGPAVNLLLAAACVVLLTAWIRLGPEGTALYRNAATFLYTGVFLNLVLAPFNLLPVPPLDGATILGGIFPRIRELYSHPQAAIFGLFAFLAVFFMSPVGDIFFEVAGLGARGLVNAAGAVVGNPPLAHAVAG